MSDLSTTSWSEVDASNNQTPPEGWPAGMFANAVEGAARMNMGAVKRFWNRINPVYLATLTTTDTYAVTETQAMDGYRLYERRRTRFPNANVSSSVTVNHSSLGAIFFKKYDGAGNLVNIASGDIQAKDHDYWWDGTEMVLTNPSSVTLGSTKKASPTSSDSVVIADAAAASAQKLALLSAIPGVYPNKAAPTTADSVVITDASAGSTGRSATLDAVLGLVHLRQQVFTTSGTFVTSGDASHVYKFTVIGGGGGGGSVDGTGGSQAAGGGGGGGTAIYYGTGVAAGSSVTVQVGIGGAAGANGVASNIVFNGTTVTANGGSTGSAGVNGNNVPGGAGGSAGSGTLNISGQAGGPGIDVSANSVAGGQGGSSTLGGGGLGGVNGGGTGGSGSLYGAGGGGASVTSGNGTATGGAGGKGVVLVEWVQ